MRTTSRVVALGFVMITLAVAGGCRRTAGDRRAGASEDPALTAEGAQDGRRARVGARPSGSAPGTAPGAGAAPAPRPEARADPRARPREADMATPTDAMDRLPTDPRAKRKAQPKDDGGKVGLLRLDMPPAAPLQLATPGAEPRRTLRYLLREGDQLVWEAEVSQRTELRREKVCPALDAPAHTLQAPDRTIPLTYRVEVVSRVTTALPDRLTLETGFRKVRLTLPPGLADELPVLASIVSNATYSTTMSRTGHVRSFTLGKLSGVAMKELLGRVRTPLGMLQPVLPEPALGAGATWRHVHRLALPQPGGRVDAVYTSTYRLAKLVPAGPDPTALIQVITTVSLSGQVMGEAYRGQGRGQSLVQLDLNRGLLRTAKGQMKICTAVLGRSSTNQTTYRQTWLPAESKLAPAKAAAKGAPGTPGMAAPDIAAPGKAAPGMAAPAPAPAPRR